MHKLDGTIVECNTAYGGSRSSTLAHRQVIKVHGFDAIATVDIMDEDGSMEIPVTGGEHLKVDRVGSHLANYDSMVVLTHFKGHAMGGFGGALKNISIGVASQEGKNLIHTAGHTDKFQWGAYGPIDTPEHVEFIEAVAEAALGVPLYLCGGGTIPILVMWLASGMSPGAAVAFMLSGPATKINNLAALKAILGLKHFAYYLGFISVTALILGLSTHLMFMMA